MNTQRGKKLWVEKEFYWDPKVTKRQKVNSEFADDVQALIEPYGVKQVYMDPSAESFALELRRRGVHVVKADNDVFNGIQTTSTMLRNGQVVICSECVNLIREVQTYTWDSKKALKGDDEPVKRDDHACDALRYALHTHKVSSYDPYKDKQRHTQWKQNRFGV